VRVRWHNLEAGGWVTPAFEWPVMVQVQYVDRDGNPQIWRYGWYVEPPGDGFRKDDPGWGSIPIYNDQLVQPGVWVANTFDLLAELPGAQTITCIRVGGSGWDFEGEVDNVSLRATPGPQHSRPRRLVWNSWFMPGQYQFRLFAEASEGFFDPNGPAIIGADRKVWRYDFFPKSALLERGTAQEPAIYWVSVAAWTSTNTLQFGWKTSTNHFQDAAVHGHLKHWFSRQTHWTPMNDWQPMSDPRTGDPLDLAFAITTLETNWPPCPEPKFFVQPPDTSPNGLDVLANWPTLLADDFLCTNSGAITNITIWGSWLNDLDNPRTSFLLGLWSDAPADPDVPYSRPDKLILQWWFHPGQYFIRQVVGAQERFYDPNQDQILGADTQIWRYEFPATPTNGFFWQLGRLEKPRIYWISVTAATTNFLFGWKSTPHHFLDAAVLGHVDANWTALQDWKPMHRPGSLQPLDLAFGVATDTRAPVIESIRLCPGNVTIEWTACPGQVYRLQYRSNVEGPGWTDIPGDIMALGTTATQNDLLLPERRFYRVVRLP
jgi:hypothetical protein